MSQPAPPTGPTPERPVDLSKLPAPQPGAKLPPQPQQAYHPLPAAIGPARLPGTPDDEGWHRLHRVTPLLKGWKALAVGLALLAQQRGDDLISGGSRPGGVEVLVSLGLLGLLAVGAAIWAALSWRMTRYRVDGDVLQLHSGVLFRQQRQARLDRLQAVDVVQPLLGRMLGLSELKLEVAGGAGSDVKLSYLKDDDAEELRNELLARSAGVAYEGHQAPQAPEAELVAVPVDRLVWSMVRSAGTVAAVLGVIGLAVATVYQPGAVVGLVPMAIGFVSGYWGRFSRGFGFRVAASPDGLRLRHGLLESRAQTVPPGRVQAVQMTQTLLWRGKGWWRLQVNVAGYGGGSDGEESAETVLLPVATVDESFAVLARILPDLGTDDPVGLLHAGMSGQADGEGFTVAPRRSRWLDPISWRRHGVAVTPRALLMRSGRWTRQLAIVPTERTQSLGLLQGPMQRRLALATLSAHSTPGPVRPTVQHLDEMVAASLLHEQAERAAQARAASGPERWMEKPPGS